MGVMSGHQEAVIGGGVEFMSRYSPLHANGFHANNEHLAGIHPQVPQGISADLIATIEGFSREDVDSYAVESQTQSAPLPRIFSTFWTKRIVCRSHWIKRHRLRP